MNIALDKKDDLNGVIKVHLTPEDYREGLMEKLREYARKANIKGFRKGKVPLSVVKRMYGEGAVLEELNKILSSSLQNYIKEEELKILGDPLPITSDVKLDPEGLSDYDFEYQVGLAPTFDLNLELKDPTPFYKVLVDDEMLEEELLNIQERYGDISNPEVSGEGDTLFGKLSELDADGNVVEDGWNKMFAMSPRRVKTKKVIKSMIGQKEGDIIPVKMKDLFDGDDEIRYFWERNVSGEVIRSVSDDEIKALKKAAFQFETRKVNHIDKVELNKELFDRVVPSGEIETLEAFKEKVESDLEKFFEGEARKYFEAKTVEKIIQENTIELPTEFLKKYLIASREKVSEANVDKFLEDYERSLRWELIIKSIMDRKPELQLSHEAVEARAKEVVEEQYKPMLPNATEEQLQHFATQMMSNEEAFNRLANEVLTKNIFGYIREEVKPSNEDITATEFLKLK